MPENRPRIFISHAWEDKPIVHEIENALKAAGAEVWVDHSELRGGQNLPKRISDALEWCNTLLLVWSHAAKDSEWVELEWTNALELRKIIIPCKRERVRLPAILASTLALDFHDLRKGLAELLRTLDLAKAEEKASGAAPAEQLARVIHSQLEKQPQLAKSKPPQTEPAIALRQRPKQLSKADVKQLIEKYDFYCGDYDWTKEYKNPAGKGIAHLYTKQQGSKVIYDAATGLTWQQSGSEKQLIYADAQKYVEQLNRERFAGFCDWRLPTLEEAMSLMEPKKGSDGLYIDPVFDTIQQWIWTADKEAPFGAWYVDFVDSSCIVHFLYDFSAYVRVIR